MTKIELTVEELDSLYEKLEDALDTDLLPGQLVETENIVIEIVCSDCHGTGVVTEGEHDNIVEKKCHCKIQDDTDDDS